MYLSSAETPCAICGHRDQELFPQTAHRGHLASSDLLSQLDIEPSNEPFQGGTGSFWTMWLTFAFGRPQISKFRQRNPVEPETPNQRVFFAASYGVPSEVSRKLRADRAPGRRFGFLGKEQKNTSDLKPPLLDLSIALLFFKSRVL